MPKSLTPEDRWENEFQVPVPGEPRRIGPLELLFQRLLNRTERLKNRIAAILGTAWDAAPPDTLAGLAGRLSAMEARQGQPNGIPLLDSIGALASPDAYLDRGFVASPVDWNALTKAGVYKIHSNAFGSGATNYPPATYRYGTLLVFRSSSPATIVQLYIPHWEVADNYIYFRESWNDTDWSPWRAVGFMFGSNANGSYIRFADGTQICWAFGVADGPDPQIVVYPAAFVGVPVVVVTPFDWPPLLVSLDKDWGLGTTQQRFRKYNADGSPYTGPFSSFSYIAIGRWK